MTGAEIRELRDGGLGRACEGRRMSGLGWPSVGGSAPGISAILLFANGSQIRELGFFAGWGASYGAGSDWAGSADILKISAAYFKRTGVFRPVGARERGHTSTALAGSIAVREIAQGSVHRL
jgi:hypothetical protein